MKSGDWGVQSIQTSDEGSNGLYIAGHLTHFLLVQIKFYPSKGRMDGWLPGWLRPARKEQFKHPDA